MYQANEERRLAIQKIYAAQKQGNEKGGRERGGGGEGERQKVY